jgi:hypothetical protein
MKGAGQALPMNPEHFPGREPGNRSAFVESDTWRVHRRHLAPPLFVAAFLVLALPGCGGSSGASRDDKDKAVAAAKFIYAGKAKQDLRAGPCIAETIPGLSDWAVDIAHDPRQPVDDQPANQCQSFRNGETHHFVELTPQGQLIRAQ